MTKGNQDRPQSFDKLNKRSVSSSIINVASDIQREEGRMSSGQYEAVKALMKQIIHSIDGADKPNWPVRTNQQLSADGLFTKHRLGFTSLALKGGG